MNYRTLAAGLAAGFVAGLAAAARTRPAAHAGRPATPDDDVEATSGARPPDTAATTAFTEAQASPTGAPGTGSDSPNTAERLQADNLTGSPLREGSPLAEAVRNEDMFSSSSQHGPEPRAPGLPDFTRGA